MLSSIVFLKVDKVYYDITLINGFEYHRVRSTIPKDISISLYIKKKYISDIKEDNYYLAPRAYLTSIYSKEDEYNDFSFRVDFLESSTKEEFEEQCSTTVNFNTRLNKKDSNSIKRIGPMRVPTYSIRAVLKNESDNIFTLLLVGFHVKAKMLNELSKLCYVDITGTVSAPRKPGSACAVILKEYVLRKEVEL